MQRTAQFAGLAFLVQPARFIERGGVHREHRAVLWPRVIEAGDAIQIGPDQRRGARFTACHGLLQFSEGAPHRIKRCGSPALRSRQRVREQAERREPQREDGALAQEAAPFR